MSSIYFSIANKLGYDIHFKVLLFQELKKLENVQGVAIVLKKRNYWMDEAV
jgi:hypothetical protein